MQLKGDISLMDLDGVNNRLRKTNDPIRIVTDYYGIRQEDIFGDHTKKLVKNTSSGQKKVPVVARQKEAFFSQFRNWVEYPLEISRYQIKNNGVGIDAQGNPRQKRERHTIDGEIVDNYQIIQKFCEDNFVMPHSFEQARKSYFEQSGRELPLEDIEDILVFRAKSNANMDIEERNELIKTIRNAKKNLDKEENNDSSNKTDRGTKKTS